MRAILVLAVLALLYLLVRNLTDFDVRLDDLNPVLLGYGALFAAGIVAAELLRPILLLLAPVSRFVVVAVIAALVWTGFETARQAGKIPQALLDPAPAGPEALTGPPQTSLPPAWDGLYRTVAQVNNTSLGVLVDPATPLVVLQYEEAERLGLHPERLQFTERVPVSDRKITAAHLPLLSVRINDVEVFEVDAAIAAKGALETSLIGLSFLNRLSAVYLKKGELVLRQ